MKKLGIVGGGQLGRMLAEAANKINVSTIVLDPTPNSPAGQVTAQMVGDFKDPVKIRKLSTECEFLTFEIESTNAAVLKELLAEGIKIRPSPNTLAIIQDKFLQKEFLLANNIPIPQYAQVESGQDIKRVGEYLGYPLVLKSRFHAYDGRGNFFIKNEKDILAGAEKLKSQKLYIERGIPFKKELAIQIVKAHDGQVMYYPVVETIQKNNICHVVKYPAGVAPKTVKEIEKITRKVVSLLKGAGIYSIEFFQTKDDKILLNEIALRVHNSGHWTIEGCDTSQFENQVRAICNLPIKSTKAKVASAVMINILGTRNGPVKLKGLDEAKKINGVFVHIYGKKETRKQRKMGHITAVGENIQIAYENASAARNLISI